MPRPGPARIGLAPLLCLVPAMAAVGRAGAQESATLTGWRGPAAMASIAGPGEPLFLLRASARWAAGAPGQRDRYAVEARLPGGRVERRPLVPSEGPGSPIVTVQVPAAAVRNRLPGAVAVEARLVDAATGAALSNPLAATIEQFPTSAPPGARQPAGPFSRGRPLDAAREGAAVLPNPGPDGWRFARIAASDAGPGFFLAISEASNRQVASRLPDHDPNAGRSDEFLLDDPDQPAVNLSPRKALAYLEALRDADPAGLPYRLPTRAEWERAARAGRPSGFWWGEDGAFPAGANFLGPEPGAEPDTTVPAMPGASGFAPNRWGLVHTFGNVAEWASDRGASGPFARMGGHFRTEPGEASEPSVVEDADGLGTDPFVGLRPAFDLEAEAGEALIRGLLAGDPALAGVVAAFDPDRATATLSGAVAEPSDRRRAVDRLASLWFLAAISDEMEVPPPPPGRLARIAGSAGSPTASRVLGRAMVRVPVAVRWEGSQPVLGSDWYANVFGDGGGTFSHRLGPAEPGKPVVGVSVPEAMLGAGRSVRVALSLGGPAASAVDPALVSDVARIAVNP